MEPNYQAAKVAKHLKSNFNIYHRGSATVDLYTPNSAKHGSNAIVERLEQAQSEIVRLKKQHEDISKQCKQLKIDRTNAIQAMLDAVAKNDNLKAQLTKLMQQDSKARDTTRLQNERDAAIAEYNLVMQERDSVHKDIDRLQDELHVAQRTCSILESEKRMSASEIENLKDKLGQICQERDKALTDCQELRNRLNRVMSETAAALASTAAPSYDSNPYAVTPELMPNRGASSSANSQVSTQSMLDSSSSILFNGVAGSMSRNSSTTDSGLQSNGGRSMQRSVAEQIWQNQQHRRKLASNAFNPHKSTSSTSYLTSSTILPMSTRLSEYQTLSHIASNEASQIDRSIYDRRVTEHPTSLRLGSMSLRPQVSSSAHAQQQVNRRSPKLHYHNPSEQSPYSSSSLYGSLSNNSLTTATSFENHSHSDCIMKDLMLNRYSIHKQQNQRQSRPSIINGFPVNGPTKLVSSNGMRGQMNDIAQMHSLNSKHEAMRYAHAKCTRDMEYVERGNYDIEPRSNHSIYDKINHKDDYPIELARALNDLRANTQSRVHLSSSRNPHDTNTYGTRERDHRLIVSDTAASSSNSSSSYNTTGIRLPQKVIDSTIRSLNNQSIYSAKPMHSIAPISSGARSMHQQRLTSSGAYGVLQAAPNSPQDDQSKYYRIRDNKIISQERKKEPCRSVESDDSNSYTAHDNMNLIAPSNSVTIRSTDSSRLSPQRNENRPANNQADNQITDSINSGSSNPGQVDQTLDADISFNLPVIFNSASRTHKIKIKTESQKNIEKVDSTTDRKVNIAKDENATLTSSTSPDKSINASISYSSPCESNENETSDASKTTSTITATSTAKASMGATLCSDGENNGARMLDNPLASYGFEISDTSSTGAKGIFVTAIKEGSIAERLNIKVGDQLLEVNGVNLRGVSRAAACRVFSYQTEDPIRIACRRKSSPNNAAPMTP